MPPPVNTSFATAIDLGALPATLTGINASDGAGTNYDLYYKFTALTSSRVVGAWAFTPIADAFVSTITPWLGPAGAPTQVLGIGANNIPIQFPVIPGSEYFIKLAKNGNTSPALIDLNLQVAINGAVAQGNIIVNDDAAGFPLVVLSHTANDTYVTFVKNMASGEAGDILPSGEFALEEVFNGHVIIYDSLFTQLADLDFNVNEVKIRVCTVLNKFYVAENKVPGTDLYTISSSGVRSTLIASPSAVASGVESIAAKNDGLILYYADKGSNVAIKRWDLTTNLALSNLVAGIVGYSSPDILYLSNDTIIVLYYNSATKDVQTIQYSTVGAVLNTYALGAQTGSVKPRMAYAIDNPDSFWVWTHNTSGRSIFRNVKCSDGSIITTRTHQEYEGGAYNASETATPVTRFGNSFSCPFFIARIASPKGMFKVTPNRRSDHNGTNDVAIPTPTWKTGLIP